MFNLCYEKLDFSSRKYCRGVNSFDNAIWEHYLTFLFWIVNHTKNNLELFQKFLEQFQKFLEWQTIQKKLKLDVYKKKEKKVELPGLELTAGEVFRSCQSWTLYHCTTKLRHLIQLKFLFKNVSFMDYWQNCCFYYCNSVFYSHIPTLVFTVTTLLRY